MAVQQFNGLRVQMCARIKDIWDSKYGQRVTVVDQIGNEFQFNSAEDFSRYAAPAGTLDAPLLHFDLLIKTEKRTSPKTGSQFVTNEVVAHSVTQLTKSSSSVPSQPAPAKDADK